MNQENENEPLAVPGLAGLYANHYQVGHNAFEFVIEFGQLYEGEPDARFHTRIVTNPKYAKDLLTLLRHSIERYENYYGAIDCNH